MSLEILPVHGIGDVTAGDDLAQLITAAAPWLADGDVLVVTSKIVSKAEGRLVEVPADGPEREEARQRVLAGETARVVARRGPTTIVQTHHGFVMAAAGIDASNVDKTHLVLLPEDPDASARRLRDALLARGLDVAIIVSDTMGRAWRNGLTDVALGAAGIEVLLDHRGRVDPYGNELSLTQMAVADELAAAAELVKGKTDRVPVAVVRGHPRGADDGLGAAVLVRDAASDMFSLGTAEARADGLRLAAGLPDLSHTGRHSVVDPAVGAPQVDPAAVTRALRTVDGLVVSNLRLDDGIRLTPSRDGAAALIRTGVEAHRLRAALAAEGIATDAVIDDEGVTLAYGAQTHGAQTHGAQTDGAPA